MNLERSGIPNSKGRIVSPMRPLLPMWCVPVDQLMLCSLSHEGLLVGFSSYELWSLVIVLVARIHVHYLGTHFTHLQDVPTRPRGPQYLLYQDMQAGGCARVSRAGKRAL